MVPNSPLSLTPWVRRLLVANAVVYLLSITVFTGGWFIESFGFDPRAGLQRPWTVVTYLFLHGGFFHLAFNMLMLFFFGPPLEARWRGTTFVRYYLLCGIGGAALSLALVAVAPQAAIIGASGAIYGVMLGFAYYWPDAPIHVFPLPFPIKVRWLVTALIGIDVLFAVWAVQDGVAHLAHLGGAGAGLLFLRWRAAAPHRASPAAPREPVRVLARPVVGAAGGDTERSAKPRPGYDEVDRVLDKISATGLQSLSDEERRLLDDVSERLRRH